MTNYPEFSVEQRDEQPYVGSTATVTMEDFAPVADRLPEMMARLADKGIEPTGAPFFRYRVIDMERELLVQAGVPVAQTPTGLEGLEVDVLPAGRYVTTTYTGPYDDLVEVTGRLLDWSAQQGLTYDMHPGDDGDVWGSRLEFFDNDPTEVSDPSQLQSTLAFRLAD